MRETRPFDEDRLVSRDQLAALLQVNPRTVARMVERGELPRPCLSEGGRPRWMWGYVLEHCRRRHDRLNALDRRTRNKLKPALSESNHELEDENP